jgi:hypothetical protein
MREEHPGPRGDLWGPETRVRARQCLPCRSPRWSGLVRETIRSVAPSSIARCGRVRGDGYLIAVTALTHGLAVVTRNVREFCRVPGLAVKEWADLLLGAAGRVEVLPQQGPEVRGRAVLDDVHGPRPRPPVTARRSPQASAPSRNPRRCPAPLRSQVPPPPTDPSRH